MTKVVHCKKEPFDVYIGRGSKWGNPFSHLKNSKAEFIVNSRKEAIEKYKIYILNNEKLLSDLPELEGKILGCYCAPKYQCHGEVLIELLNMKKLEDLFS